MSANLEDWLREVESGAAVIMNEFSRWAKMQQERQMRIEQQPKEKRVAQMHCLLSELDQYGKTHFSHGTNDENEE